MNDEMRKRPFTVPVVRVEIPCDSGVDASNIKTKQSRISTGYND